VNRHNPARSHVHPPRFTRGLTLPAASLALLAALLCSACGSSGQKRLSKEEYARRADAACLRYQHRIATLGTPHSTHDFARVAGRTATELARTTRTLRALRPPVDEEITARRWLRGLEGLRADAERLRNRAAANDLGGLERLAVRARAHDAAAARLATRLGMHVCNAKA
jgi:hypothetical protein